MASLRMVMKVIKTFLIHYSHFIIWINWSTILEYVFKPKNYVFTWNFWNRNKTIRYSLFVFTPTFGAIKEWKGRSFYETTMGGDLADLEISRSKKAADIFLYSRSSFSNSFPFRTELNGNYRQYNYTLFLLFYFPPFWINQIVKH